MYQIHLLKRFLFHLALPLLIKTMLCAPLANSFKLAPPLTSISISWRLLASLVSRYCEKTGQDITVGHDSCILYVPNTIFQFHKSLYTNTLKNFSAGFPLSLNYLWKVVPRKHVKVHLLWLVIQSMGLVL